MGNIPTISVVKLFQVEYMSPLSNHSDINKLQILNSIVSSVSRTILTGMNLEIHGPGI